MSASKLFVFCLCLAVFSAQAFETVTEIPEPHTSEADRVLIDNVEFYPNQKALEEDKEVKLIVLFDDKEHAEARQFISTHRGKHQRELEIVNGMSLSLPASEVQGLRESPHVKSIQEDTVVSKTLMESIDTIFGQPPPFSASSVNGLSSFGQGTLICILDTGISTSNPMLSGNVVGGASFATGYTSSWNDVDGHGTHVAATAAGLYVSPNFGSNYCNSQTQHLVGVASQAQLYAIKVLGDNGSGYTSDIINGVQHGVAQGCDVMNLSLGGGLYSSSCDSSSLAQAVNNAMDQGVVVTLASGNGGSSNGVISPACASKPICVGASESGTCGNAAAPAMASFSNYIDSMSFKYPDVVAPGTSILAAGTSSTGYSILSGTSMATPHVAGLAALLRGECPCCTAYDIKNAIIAGATSIVNNPGSEGAGEIRVEAALNALPSCGFCGDDICNGDETCDSCPGDCGACPYCGDETCNNGETCDTCPGDCGACPCGDDICNGDETCDTCPGDCGVCPYCGDGTCNNGETCGTCSEDCGACPYCGDGTCNGDETCNTCSEDCGACPCLPRRAVCTQNSDCCSNSCRRNGRCR